MTLSTSTVTLAPGSSRTYTLAPGEAVTVATEPNCYVTVTETPDVISSADLDGQTNVRTSILQYKGEWTYGPYALGGTVVVDVSSTKSTSSVSATLGSSAAAVVGAALFLVVQPTGVDDTDNIQAALDLCRLNGGGTVALKSGGEYAISSRLVIGSNTSFLLGSARLELLPGNPTNMVVSHATNSAVIGQATTTSGSNVVTTALAASATVGQTLIVTGAGANGTGRLVGNISAKTETTVTLVDQRGRALNASASVSNAPTKLVTRDRNIKILGGRWDRGANGPNSGIGPETAIAGHSLFLKHIDGLHVDLDRVDSTGGVTFVWITDCTDWQASVRGGDVVRTIMQIVGPVYRGHIPLVSGTCNDDLINLCGNVYVDQTDTSGDVVDIRVDAILAHEVGGSALKINAGTGCTVDQVSVGHIGGMANIGFFAGDDYNYASTTGGTYGTIEIGYLGTVGFGVNPKTIYTFTPNMRSLNVMDGVLLPLDPIWMQGTSTSTAIESMKIKFSSVSTQATTCMRILQNARIRLLEIENAEIDITATASVVRVYGSGRVDKLIGDCCRVEFAGADSVGFRVYETGYVGEAKWRDSDISYVGVAGTTNAIYASAGTLLKAMIDGGSITNGAAAIRVDSGVTASSVHLDGGVTFTTPDRLLNIRNAAIDVHLGDVRCVTPASPMVLFNNGAGTYNVYGQNIVCNTATAKVARNAGTETINVYAPSLQVDLAILPKTAGQQASNTNAALVLSTFGTGLSVSNGTAWKNVYTGITY